MKKQRMTTEAKSFGFFKIALVLVMLTATLCCLTVAAYANAPTVSLSDLQVKVNDGEWTSWDSAKLTYGDTFTVQQTNGTPVTVTVVGDGLKAGSNIVKLEFKDGTSWSTSIKVAPKLLTWSGNAAVTAIYGDAGVTVDALGDATLVGVLNGDNVQASVNAVIDLAQGLKVGTYSYSAEATLSGDDAANYTVAPLPVEVTVNPVKIISIALPHKSFTVGAEIKFEIFGNGENGGIYLLNVQRAADDSKVGSYTYTVCSPDADNISFNVDGLQTQGTYDVVAKEYVVDADAFVSLECVKGNAADVLVPTISIPGVPADILAQVTYTVVDGTITATLPTSTDYKFVDANGNDVKTLTATKKVNNAYLAAGDADKPYQIIVYSENGVPADMSASVSAAEIPEKLLKSFPYYVAYNFKLSGSDGVFAALIPADASLYHKRCSALTEDDLYVYDAEANKLVPAKEVLTVSWKDGYYCVNGIAGESDIVFLMAPAYNTPFFLSPIGIALIALLVVALVVVMFLVGMYLRRLREVENEEIVIDETGDAPEVVAAEAPELVDLDATTEEHLDAMEGELAEVVEPAEVEVDSAEVEEEKTDAMNELMSDLPELEAEEIVEAAVEEPAEAAPEVVEETAAEVAPEATEEVTEEVAAEVVEEAVAEEAVETVVEEAAPEAVAEEPAVEAIAVVETEDEENESEEEDDEDESFAFGDMDLDFFDAVEEADRYAELVEQEKRGEIRIVTRYRRSFQSRMIQSQGNVQDYYSEIKNALLAYKGVKSRVSWNYDAFNKGRAHVAKITAKTKTLYLYLAIDPAELADTKYTFVDVSSKKKYATVPVLMKIKGERKFKHALELIDKICGENLQLPKMEVEAVDYRIPYATTEELVQTGVVKKLVASVPVVYGETEVSEEPVAPVTPATEDQEVTFVAPADAPAVEAAAEEIVADEVAAAAEVTEADNSEI